MDDWYENIVKINDGNKKICNAYEKEIANRPYIKLSDTQQIKAFSKFIFSKLFHIK